MTIEFNEDDHNDILIAIVTGEFESEKVEKVIKMTLNRCDEKNIPRALIDLAQLENIDTAALEKFFLGTELASEWGQKLKMCIVYDHKFIAEIEEKAKEGPGGWALLTTNKNQSVFWLLASEPSAN